jgi:hypothetical protein
VLNRTEVKRFGLAEGSFATFQLPIDARGMSRNSPNLRRGHKEVDIGSEKACCGEGESSHEKKVHGDPLVHVGDSVISDSGHANNLPCPLGVLHDRPLCNKGLDAAGKAIGGGTQLHHRESMDGSAFAWSHPSAFVS